MTIAEMLARNARMYGGETALIELEPSKGLRKTSTWAEFDRRANHIANALTALGIRKGDKVIRFTAGYPTLQLKGCGEESGFLSPARERLGEGELKAVVLLHISNLT